MKTDEVMNLNEITTSFSKILGRGIYLYELVRAVKHL